MQFRTLILATLFASTLPLLQSADLSWDGEPGTPNANYGPANAIWDTSTITWISGNTATGTATLAWENSLDNVAQFKSGTVGSLAYPAPATFTLTLAEDIIAKNIDIGGSFAPSITITDGGNDFTLTVSTLSPNGAPLTVDAVIAGSSGLLKQNGGIANLNRANIYLGNTTVSAGLLVANHEQAFSSGTVNINGASSRVQLNNVAVANNFNLNGNHASGTLEVKGTLTLNGNIAVSSESSITQSASGGITTFNGNINLSGGPLTILAGHNTFTGTLAGTQDLTIRNGNSTFQVTNNTLTGTITQNAGTIQLNSTGNSIRGDLVLNGGTALVWQKANQIADTASITVNSGTLNTGNRADTIKDFSFLSPTSSASTFSGLTVTGTFTLVNSGIHDLINSGGVFNSNKAVLSGGATLKLGANSGDSTWTVGAGGLEMEDITVQFGSNGGASSGILNLQGNVTGKGTNTFIAPNNSGPRTVNLQAGARTFDIQSGVTRVDNIVTIQNGSLVKTGAGILRVESGGNTYAGGTTINGGAYMAANGILSTSGSATGTGNVVVGAAGILSGHGKISGPISVSGTLSPGNDSSKAFFGLGTLIAENTLSFSAGSNLILEFLAVSASNPAYATNPSLITSNPGAGAQQDFIDVGSTLTLNSDVDIRIDITALNLKNGDVLDLFDFSSLNLNGFNPNSDFTIIGSTNGLVFDTSLFQNYGVLIAVVPEPSRCLLGLAALATLMLRRQRH